MDAAWSSPEIPRASPIHSRIEGELANGQIPIGAQAKSMHEFLKQPRLLSLDAVEPRINHPSGDRR
jgi:hypothetical protein